MTINVPGFSPSTRAPGAYFAVVLGGGGVPAGSRRARLLLLGNMIAADLTDGGGASPAYTVAAGTRQSGGTASQTPVLVSGADDAATKFGRGSELHRMAQRVFDAYPTAELWCCPVAESAGTAASATLTLVGSATSAGTIRVWVAGKHVDVAIASGDTVTTMALAIATAIMQRMADAPVVAQSSSGVLTVTAKHKGPRGNNVTFRAQFVSSTGTTTDIGSSTSGFGTAATITGSGKLASGATADTVATALTNCANMRFHRVACAHVDTTNINLIRDAIETKASATSMLWEQLVCGSTKSPSNVIGDVTAVNSARVQMVQAESCDASPGEMAAQMAATRLLGDGQAGGDTTGEERDPAANLNGVALKSIPAQYDPALYPTPTEIESMLTYGVTPLVPDPARPGYLRAVGSYTTRAIDASSTLNYSVDKTKAVTVSDYIAETFRDDVQTRYRRSKLKADPAVEQPQRIPGVVTPSTVRGRLLVMLREAEAAGIIANVDDHVDELVVMIDPANNRRLLISIPQFPIPDLDQVAARVDQLSA